MGDGTDLQAPNPVGVTTTSYRATHSDSDKDARFSEAQEQKMAGRFSTIVRQKIGGRVRLYTAWI
jgi:hypothetical protein